MGLRRAGFALFLLLCCWQLPAWSVELADTIDRVRPSIVGIGSLQPMRTPRVALFGTGFVVGDGRHVITNAHVVDNLEETQRHENLSVLVGRGSRPQVRRAEKVAMDLRHDLVLLEIEGAALPPLPLADSNAVREGESFLFTGFPIGGVLGLYPVTHRAMISAITPIVAPMNSGGQLTAEVIARLRDPFDVLQLDATAYPGNSGSPLYHPATGSVVGVVNMVFVKETRESVLERPSGIAYAIPIQYARELLQTRADKKR